MIIKEVSAFGMGFQTPLMNAAGTVKTCEDFYKLIKTDLGAIVIGSITKEPRLGNGGNVWDPRGLNSLGMPNPGLRYMEEYLPKMIEDAHFENKKVIVSVAGFNQQQFVDLTLEMFELGADLVEINFGCPNILNDGKRKPIFSFDSKIMYSTLALIADYFSIRHGEHFKSKSFKRIIVKLSPYSNPAELEDTIKELDELDFGGFTLCNTFPKGFMFDENMNSAITPDGGLGGVSGLHMKPVALGQIIQAKSLISPNKTIIGVGGISCGRDIHEFEKVGASLMQVGTAYLQKSDPTVFNQILAEYYEYEPVK